MRRGLLRWGVGEGFVAVLIARRPLGLGLSFHSVTRLSMALGDLVFQRTGACTLDSQVDFSERAHHESLVPW